MALLRVTLSCVSLLGLGCPWHMSGDLEHLSCVGRDGRRPSGHLRFTGTTSVPGTAGEAGHTRTLLTARESGQVWVWG